MKARSVAIAGLLAVALAACGDEGTPAPGPGADGAPTPAPTGRDYGAAPDAATVTAGDSDHGPIVTDADGRTLYVFTVDEGGESACYDDCATAWPALTIDEAPSAGTGIDAGLLGTTERTDGGTQVTYAGMPLYYFADDAAPGDTNGQGIGDVWFVVSPEGEPIR